VSDNFRILIVDDDYRMAKTLRDILIIKGYETDLAHSGSEALEKVEETYYTCILSDIKMPEVNGVELYRAIKKIEPDLPVVLMTAYSHDKLIKKGLEEGAIAVLFKPLDINAVLNFFSILRKGMSIVIVDDDPQFCKTLGDILRTRDFVVNEVSDPSGIADRIKPDSQVVLLDMKLKGVSGLDVLKEIRAQYPYLPVVLVTGYREEMSGAVEAALKISTYTCLYKPFEIEELLQLLNKIRRQELARILGRSVRKRE